jgi:ribosomal protein S18 acetylase RimI-like enzyme
MPVEVRAAIPDDVEAVVDVLAEVSTWLRAKGVRQWPDRFSEDFFGGYVRRGQLFVATVDAAIVGTVTLQWSDPPFWGDRDDAGFVHRLAVRRSHAGSGRSLLQWAEEQTLRHDRRFVCLDTLSSNTRLRRYYEDLGFRAVGEIAGPADHPTAPGLGRWSATLYEKPIGEPKL